MDFLTDVYTKQVFVYTNVSEDVAMLSAASNAGGEQDRRPKPVLQKSLSMHQFPDENLPR